MVLGPQGRGGMGFLQPVDYTQQFLPASNPLAEALAGVERGLALREAYLRNQREALALEREQQLSADLVALHEKPYATAQDYHEVMLKHPQLAKNLSEAWDFFDANERSATLGHASQVVFALGAGRKDLAEQTVSDAIAAYRDAGQEDRALGEEALLSLIRENPDVAKTSLLTTMAGAMDPKAFQELLNAMQKEARAAAIHTPKLAKEKALATEAEAKARFAEPRERAALALTRTRQTAAMAAAKASLARARREAVSEKAQRAKIKKSEADALQTLRDLKLVEAGKIPVKDRFDAELKLNTKYLKDIEPYRRITSSYNTIMSATAGGAGDHTRVTTFARMLDPVGAVLEGERKAIAEAMGGLAELETIATRVLWGGVLEESFRIQVEQQAKILADLAQAEITATREGVGRIADRKGLDREVVFTKEDAPLLPLPERDLPPARPGVDVWEGEGLFDSLRRRFGAGPKTPPPAREPKLKEFPTDF